MLERFFTILKFDNFCDDDKREDLNITRSFVYSRNRDLRLYDYEIKSEIAISRLLFNYTCLSSVDASLNFEVSLLCIESNSKSYILHLIIIVRLTSIMNLIICSLHSLSQETNTIIKNSRNFDLLCLKDSIEKDTKCHSKEVALSLTLNRISKTKSNFVIDWHEDVDIVLLDSTYSVKHYTISIDYEDVTIFYEQSKNDIIINEKVCKDYNVALYDKMKIEFQKVIFLIRISWRQNLN